MQGAEHLTATAITAGARVSRTTFYAVFADREDCLLALFDEVVDRLSARMLHAYSEESSWLDGVRASLSALLEVLDSRPHLARFLIVGGVAGDSPLVVRRRAVLADLARALEADAPDRGPDGTAIPFGADALIGGAASIIHSRLSEDPVPALSELSGSLMAVLVLPFVGEGIARSELARPPAQRPRRASTSRAARRPPPLSAPRMTARTAQVLGLIAASAPISNRVLAQKAGNLDEGQMSKLLARLSALGLIANEPSQEGSHGPNAWRLTPAGAELLAAVAPAPGR